MEINCSNNILDYCLKLKGDERNTITNKVVQYNLQLPAHNCSGFDTWITLKNVTFDKHIVDILKNVKRSSISKYSMVIFITTKNKPLNI